MADKKISQLTNITGADVVDSTDELAIVDASSNETKAITREELFKSVGAVDVTGNVSLADNGRLRLGSGNDLDIYHDGANSYIAETGAGALIFRSNTYSFRNSANTEQVMLASENGAVTLYYDNSAKLATSSNGVDVTGDLTLGDNDELRLGDSDDLTIKHNATNGVITNNTNHLYLANTANDKDVYIQTDDGSGGITNYFAADGSSGEAKLYYYGSEKLNTKSSGVDITGNLATSDKIIAKVVTYAANQNAPYMIAATTSFTGAPTNAGTYGLQHRYKYDSGGSSRITVDGAIGGVGAELWALYSGSGNMDVYGSLDVGAHVDLPDNGELRFGDSNDLILEHNGSNGDIRNQTNDLLIRNLADDRDVRIISDDGSGGTADYFRADGSTGEAQLFYYGSEKLNTLSNGVYITGAITLAASDPFIKLTDTSTNVDHEIDANSGVGNLVIHTDINSEGSDSKLLLKVAGTTGITVRDTGNVDIAGALSKGSGSFKIDHPLKPETHHLVHSFVEAPQADNIYRGKVALVDGSATVNLDNAGRMTEGTFVLLNGNIQCFTSNEDGWTSIKGSVSGNTLTIQAQDASCTDTVSWLVIGERHDQHMVDTDWTDAAGRVITEPEKQPEEEE